MTGPRSPAVSPRARLDRLVLIARGALLWETGWRALASVLVAGALFVALAWSGLLLDRPPAARIAALVLCLALGLYGAARAIIRAREKGVRADRRAALARIDRDSGFAHGQASGFEDTLANPADPAAAVLWRLHQSRLATALGAARVGAPRPALARFDRYAVRAGAVLLVLAAAFIAGEERSTRLAAALDWGQSPPAAVPSLRIDAWIDPPGYTGRPPIILGSTAPGAPQRTLAAPVGSAVVVRASDPAAVTIATEGALAAKPAEPPSAEAKPEQAKPGEIKPAVSTPSDTAAAATDGTRRFALRGDGTLTVSGGGQRAAYSIAAIPDLPPTVEVTSPPKPNLRGTFSVGYRLGDDYGVIGAEARFSAPEIDGKPVTGRTLVAPPRVGLALPAGQNGLGEATTTVDLSDHPWAGIRATLVLHAQDEGGNEGVSQPVAIQLPQRRFTKPLARALVEQRRNLVLDPDRRERVASALDALMIAPDVFGTVSSEYLGLHIGVQRLAAARTDDALRDVADYLWGMALQIEDGDLSGTERDLRSAQKELRDAIARGAPDEEIRRLTENLRAAMDKFLNEMMERQAREDAERGDTPPRDSRNARTITRDDLKAMMDRMEEMARSGNLAEAQRMLEQMQQLMENLRTAKRGRRNPQAQEMREMFDDLDALTREQDRLRDDTFRSARPKSAKPPRRKGQPNASPSEDGEDDDTAENGDGKEGSGALKQRQQALRDKLGELERRIERMRRGRGDKKLGDAESAMRDAEGALDDEDGQGDQPGQGGQPGGSQPGSGSKGRAGRGGRDAAVEAQGRALEALRQGAQNLAQRGQGQQGQESGDGFGDDDAMADGDGEPEPGQPREGGGGTRDPLGRPTSRDPLYNPRAKYDPLGASPALRAQRVLEELRRRLGDPSRPQGELDYLERLLKRY